MQCLESVNSGSISFFEISIVLKRKSHVFIPLDKPRNTHLTPTPKWSDPTAAIQTRLPNPHLASGVPLHATAIYRQSLEWQLAWQRRATRPPKQTTTARRTPRQMQRIPTVAVGDSGCFRVECTSFWISVELFLEAAHAMCRGNQSWTATCHSNGLEIGIQ
jgi:hypothetical protein